MASPIDWSLYEPVPACGKCGEKIIGQYYQYLNTTVHYHCFFNCAFCNGSVAEGFRQEPDSTNLEARKPHCLPCFSKRFVGKCRVCDRYVFTDHYVQFRGGHARTTRFRCVICQDAFGGASRFWFVGGRFYCQQHNHVPKCQLPAPEVMPPLLFAPDAITPTSDVAYLIKKKAPVPMQNPTGNIQKK